MSGSVDLVIRDQVAHLYLNNPEKKNAISAEMWEDLKAKAGEISIDTRVRATILRGHGLSAFAAGADISQFESRRSANSEGSTYDELTESAVAAVKSIPVPVVAAIHGFCLGGGISLALACDLRFAANDSTFAIPAARLGISYPTPAIERLVGLIGTSNAKYLLFSAKRIGAQAAKEIHLIDKVFKQEELDEEVETFVATLINNAPLSLKAAKYIIDQCALEHHERDLENIHQVSRNCFLSEDYKEGVRAFMESRKPIFQGK
ncbi:MAG: enoyl-CoA hydratase [Acidimicrobiaceae bacterium]|nr:enoyl-CoA hydratase [Acidimicrobiaceae bacterium]